MERVGTYFKKYGMLIIMLALIIVVANVCRKSSPITYAKYRVSVDGTDTSRVAKWQITKKSILNGENIQLDSGFRTEILDGSGTWAFQITNDSEVTATIEPNSKIRIRLDNDSFKRDSLSEIGWNFLYNDTKAIDNPISFKIKVYKANIKDLLKYQSGTTILTYDEYMNLDSSAKESYKQIVDEEVETRSFNLSILDLSAEKPCTFELDSENVNSKMIYYYYYDIDFISLISAVENKDEVLKLEIGNNNNLTFIIDWNVSNLSTSSGEKVENENTYYGYKLVEDAIPSGFTSYPTATSSMYMLDGKTYYVCRSTGMNFYEYTKYTSALIGGEPGFEFISDAGGIMKVKYSDLDGKQKGEILNYVDASRTSTLSDLKHYIEKLEYTQYTSYLKDNEELQATLGYLSYGLKVNIQFELKVSQVKPGN